MKIFVFAILLTGLTPALLLAANHPVALETDKGHTIEVTVVSEGPLNLYSQQTEVLPATIPQEPATSYTKSYTAYYVARGDGDLTEIHCANYKKVLKAQMKDNTDLAGKIGKKGYKFQDIERVISDYNQE
jgi:hypothetical protein